MGSISRKIIGITIVGFVTIGTVSINPNPNEKKIVMAAESEASVNAGLKILKSIQSINGNYAGIKNQVTWEMYINEGKAFVAQMPASERDKALEYTAKLNDLQKTVLAIARINHVEKSYDTNYKGIKNAAQWRNYLNLAKNDMERIDKSVFRAKYDELLKRYNDIEAKVKAIEDAHYADLAKVQEKFNSAKSSNNLAEAEEALDEANKLGTHETSAKIKGEIEELIKSIYISQGLSIPSIKMTSNSETTITFDVIYPDSNAYGNRLELWDSVANRWYEIHPKYHMINGSYTFDNLPTGRRYVGRLTYLSNDKVKYIDVNVYTNKANYNKSGKYIRLDFDDSYLSEISPENLTKWLNNLDTAYLSYKSLVGKTPENGEIIKVVDSNETHGWAWVYLNRSTIYWQENWISREFASINETGNWSFGILHEMGHLFDIDSRWNFDAEFFANFKMYYVIETNNGSVEQNYRIYTGNELSNYYEKDATESYTKTLSKGTYAGDGLLYSFIKIKNNIGWEPFKETFTYFNNLPLKDVSSNKIDKFNLFMTKLRDYSGYDVLSTYTQIEKDAIGRQFGGTVNYKSNI